MSDNLVNRWDDYVESMGSVMGDVEHMAQQMRDRIEALTAERNEALNQLDSARHSVEVLEKRVEKFMADNARLREALTFYADEENYKGVSLTDPCGCCSSWYEPKIHIDGEDSGHIARAALNTGKEPDNAVS